MEFFIMNIDITEVKALHSEILVFWNNHKQPDFSFSTFLFVQVLPCGMWKCRYWSCWQMSCVLLTEWLWVQNLLKYLRYRQTKCHLILAFHSLTSNYKYSRLLINSVPGPLAGEKGTAMLWETTPLLHLAHFSSWKWFTGLKNACLYCCGKVHLSVEGKKQQNKGWFWKNGFCVSIKRLKGGKADGLDGLCLLHMLEGTNVPVREGALRWIAVIKLSLFSKKANEGGSFKASDGEDFPHSKEMDHSGMNGVGKR